MTDVRLCTKLDYIKYGVIESLKEESKRKINRKDSFSDKTKKGYDDFLRVKPIENE